MNSMFINLYNETEYTMLGSSLRIKDLVNHSVKNGLKSCAITDLNNMYGVIPFYQECTLNNIKPIIGSHITLESDFNYFNSILLICKNNSGYKNLMRIVTLRKLEKKLTIEMILPLLDGLVVILPNTEHELIKAYNEKNGGNFESIYQKYQGISDLYLGLDMQTNEMKKNIGSMIDFFTKKNIKLVAIHKTTFLLKDDFKVYKILKCVKENIKDYNETEHEKNQYFLSPFEANDLFRYYPSLITNVNKIVDDCNVVLDFDNYHMPKYEVKGIENTNDYLHDLAFVGLKRRLETDKIPKRDYQKYIDRLSYELNVIIKMGFSDYFLIVYDFIKYAKKSNILVGPGRGSGPSSLVSYSLGITEIDPLKYDLFFERFLNPERISMPDIDTDFPENRRSQVLSYMGKRFGKMRVAHICTFGTYGPKAAIRDIARITNLNNNYLEEMLKFIGSSDSISDVINTNDLFKRMTIEDETIGEVADLIKRMENLPRNLSVHAAGIIMADKDLIDYTPLEEGLDGLYTTQYGAGSLEKLGLVKIDFLGLSNLNTIASIIKMVNNNLNVYKLPLDDKKVYQMIASGNTYGLFQIESPGMRKVLQELKTSSFNDIVSALALYRPGPMEMIPTYVKRKLGEEKVTYLHQDLEEILKPTYGIIVYQEQLLQIASKFAGYSLGEADILRRAISKKNKELLALNEQKFIKGAINKGYDQKLAKQIFDYILKFASYGFNKSHSVAYSMVTYQMAYLKVHYFKEFMCVMMSDKLGNIGLIKSYILECKKQGIEVTIPSINKSYATFTISKENPNLIYYPLQGINGIGQVTISEFLSERDTNGLYKSYDEFIARTKNIFTKKNVEALISSGALDEFNITRKAMTTEYDQSLELASLGGFFKDDLSTHVFGDEEYSFHEISNNEFNALGFNLKYDIFIKYNDIRNKYHTKKVNDLKNKDDVYCVFMLKSMKKIKTKNNEEMCFISFYDETGEIDGVIFPINYQNYSSILDIDAMYISEVKVDIRNEKLQAEIKKLRKLD